MLSRRGDPSRLGGKDACLTASFAVTGDFDSGNGVTVTVVMVTVVTVTVVTVTVVTVMPETEVQVAKGQYPAHH